MMIEMPNSRVIENPMEEMDESMAPTIMMTTISSFSLDVNFDINHNATLPPDMVFNEGHKLSIIVYR